MIALIAARAKNNVIGKNGSIPWKIEGEQSQFRELTTGNAVIMGRRTYEDIGHPLPGRLNVVVSNTASYSGENLVTARSLGEAIAACGEREIYIAGGYRMYKEALPLADKLYITEVDIVIEDGDVFFPEFENEDFDIVAGETGGDVIKYTRVIYTRKAGNMRACEKIETYGEIC